MQERERTKGGNFRTNERKQNSKRKRTISYLHTAARICRLVLEASSYMFSVHRKGETSIYAKHRIIFEPKSLRLVSWLLVAEGRSQDSWESNEHWMFIYQHGKGSLSSTGNS